MDGQSALLQLLENRLATFVQLNSLLEKQQVALIANQTADLATLSDELVTCLEKIHFNEVDWQRFSQHAAQSDTAVSLDELLTIVELDESQFLQVQEIRSQLRTVATEISRRRENNDALAENSLSFVRTLLNNIIESGQQASTYSAGGKEITTSSLINKQL